MWSQTYSSKVCNFETAERVQHFSVTIQNIGAILRAECSWNSTAQNRKIKNHGGTHLNISRIVIKNINLALLEFYFACLTLPNHDTGTLLGIIFSLKSSQVEFIHCAYSPYVHFFWARLIFDDFRRHPGICTSKGHSHASLVLVKLFTGSEIWDL